MLQHFYSFPQSSRQYFYQETGQKSSVFGENKTAFNFRDIIYKKISY